MAANKEDLPAPVLPTTPTLALKQRKKRKGQKNEIPCECLHQFFVLKHTRWEYGRRFQPGAGVRLEHTAG